jgi:glucose-1-phosphate cytidylyltransferase
MKLKTVILCGGRGTRIRDVADNIPKPMLPIGGLPILWHIMKYYSSWNYNDFVLCLGFKAEAIKDFFLNYEAHTRDFTMRLGRSRSLQFHDHQKESQWKITFADTGLDTMTGGRIRRIRKHVEDDANFMLTYGDGLGDIDIDRLIKFHQSHGKVLTVSGVRPPGRFGELRSTPAGLVTEFNEKPQATAGRISGGYFVCRKELFNYLPAGEDLIFEESPMKRLVHDRQVMVYEHDGFWQPMDTYRDYVYLEGLWEKQRAPWKIW